MQIRKILADYQKHCKSTNTEFTQQQLQHFEFLETYGQALITGEKISDTKIQKAKKDMY
jgi:hypothetical protein